jgi:hypothetical protein
MNKISIMQPTFLPWAGFFYLIKNSDKFIFLTETKLEKNSWQTKNKILTGKNQLDLIVPIVGSRLQLISASCIDDARNWRKRISTTLSQAYLKHPYGEEILKLLLPIINDKNIAKLKDLNISIIKNISNYLNIINTFDVDSEYNFSGEKSAKIKNICEYFNYKNLLSPIGSKKYIEDEGIIKRSNIDVFYLEQNPNIKYSQSKNSLFNDNISIIDIIANIGPVDTLDYIERKFKLIK